MVIFVLFDIKTKLSLYKIKIYFKWSKFITIHGTQHLKLEFSL